MNKLFALSITRYMRTWNVHKNFKMYRKQEINNLLAIIINKTKYINTGTWNVKKSSK